MIALPAPRLAIGSRTSAAVPYPLYRLTAMGSSERLGGRGGAAALEPANADAPGPSTLRGRLQQPEPKRYAVLLANLGRSAKPAAEGHETR